MTQRFSLNFDEFSLAKGGPFFKLMVHSGLIKPDFARPARRAAFFALFTWLPIFIFALFQGVAFGGVKLPFIYDFTVSVRFLICVPLLIVADVLLDIRTIAVIKHILSSGLVREKDYPALAAAVQRAAKMRDSLLAEAIIIGVVVVSVVFNRLEYLGSASTWQVL